MSQPLNRSSAIRKGVLAGAVAAVLMTLIMLLLAWSFGVATPLTLIGDRLSVLIPPGPFLGLMGKVGGYNHLKQLGVGGTIAGQIIVGVLAGLIYGLSIRRREKLSLGTTLAIFVLLPWLASILLLWPVLGTSYRGYPITPATVVTLLGLALSFLVFERALVWGYRYLTVPSRQPNELGYSPGVARRAVLLGGLGLLFAGGSAALLRRLYQVATFAYDGTEYKGAGIEPITPNDKFYCVTKNVVDPSVDESIWRLEVTGLVKHPRTYTIAQFKSLPSVTQETTLMCISNGLDAGLMSNAVWRGIPMSQLLNAAAPLPAAARVRLHGVDNYTDTFSLQKAMDPATLIAFEMNGTLLPARHGFPARVLVPGYFGEKSVKWLTRIELTGAETKGFYEKQGWGPNFIVPTRSRIDQPENYAVFSLTNIGSGILLKGIAFAGDRGVSRVEISTDKEQTWQEATIDYPGTRLTWVLWSYEWKPAFTGEFNLSVRATDGQGQVQQLEKDRSPYSGITGLHQITVYLQA
jgi:DMSO/TMAO reductase YedYZ molybdopterin-dependent catalytic subunit